MDVHVKTAITRGLRRRNVVVVRAQDDGMGRKDDPVLLDRALALGYVVFTQDADFLVEVARRQRAGVMFAGVIYARQRVVSVRRCIDDLELMAKVYDPADMMNRLVYLPI
jgi:predicted nuclease of predicted toxin-antitoxin system